jgi:hypothetical protein
MNLARWIISGALLLLMLSSIRRDGRTEIKLKMANLVYPQNLGDFYTIYILWALTPDGPTTSLAEIPMRSEFSVEAATSHQTFALIITVEPHAEVRLPSPVVLAENAQHRKTSGDGGDDRCSVVISRQPC